jgi:DNA invertase Pin-like site-specific DNA recombinase
MTSPARAALYARVSADRDQEPETQLREMRALAGQRGWTTVGEYVDRGISGAVAGRPRLDALMAAARAGEVDVVLVWRFDRFARSTTHLLQALEEFRLAGVQFVSVREQVDTTTPMGRMVFTLIAAVAEMEREIIRERVRAGLARARAEGKHCGRPRVDIDLRPALALLREGRGLKQVAAILGLPRSTLRQRLAEAGQWPPTGVEKPPAGQGARMPA